MLSSPRKPPANTWSPSGSIRLHPPGEVDQQLRQQAGEEAVVAAPVDVPHVQRRPRVHRRVDVAERPLVGGEGAVRVLEPLAAQREQLVLGERRVEMGERDRVEREVPRREPRVLPRVGHRHDVARVHVHPRRVPAEPALGWRWRLRRVAVEPAPDVVAVELLAPDHPGEGLAGHEPLVVAGAGRDQLRVELVGLTRVAGRAPRRTRS